MAQPTSLGRTGKAQGTSRTPCSQRTNGLSTTEEIRRHRALKQARTENNFPSCAGCGRVMLLVLPSLIEPCGRSFFASFQEQVWKEAPQLEGVQVSDPQPAQAVPALPSPHLFLSPTLQLLNPRCSACPRRASFDCVPLVLTQLCIFLAFLTPGYYSTQYNEIMC